MIMKETRTSDNNPIEVDFIDPELLNSSGRIAMSIAPGKITEDSQYIWERDLDIDLKRLHSEIGVSHVFCLLEDEELQEIGLSQYFEKLANLGIGHSTFPVDDFGKPESQDEFFSIVSEANQKIDAGETVLIHCNGGKGRTGMMAAACLVHKGYDPEEAIQLVKEKRKGALSVEIKCDAVREFASELNA